MVTQIIIKNDDSIDNSKVTLIDTFRNSSSRETDVKYIWKSFFFFFEEFFNDCFINCKWKIKSTFSSLLPARCGQVAKLHPTGQGGEFMKVPMTPLDGAASLPSPSQLGESQCEDCWVMSQLCDRAEDTCRIQ